MRTAGLLPVHEDELAVAHATTGDGDAQQRCVFPGGKFLVRFFCLLVCYVARQVDIGLYLAVHRIDAFVDGVQQFHG